MRFTYPTNLKLRESIFGQIHFSSKDYTCMRTDRSWSGSSLTQECRYCISFIEQIRLGREKNRRQLLTRRNSGGGISSSGLWRHSALVYTGFCIFILPRLFIFWINMSCFLFGDCWSSTSAAKDTRLESSKFHKTSKISHIRVILLRRTRKI